MASRYIYELKNWPNFKWDHSHLSEKLERARLCQGKLIGKMEGLGLVLREEAVLITLTEDIVKTSEIEGEKLDRNQVRSSVARRLGLEVAGLVRSDRNVDGVVEMMLDATQNYKKPLSADRLCKWHSGLFPTGYSGIERVKVGNWRDDSDGPMQVISGPIGKTRVHFQAPAASKLNAEMKNFLSWFNGRKSIDSILFAALAHLRFVTVHPFDDGNGRIARALTDMALARSEESGRRFYSMSTQICAERKAYYSVLESTQKKTLDITDWLDWFLGCLDRSIARSEVVLSSIIQKSNFWLNHNNANLNLRQKKVINILLDGFEGKLTSSKWAALTKCSQDTASRDIDQLLRIKILKKNLGGGRSTSYSLQLP